MFRASIRRRWTPCWKWLASLGRAKPNFMTIVSWTDWSNRASSISSTREENRERNRMAQEIRRHGARLHSLAGTGTLFFHQNDQTAGRYHGDPAESLRAPPARMLGACFGQLSGAGH